MCCGPCCHHSRTTKRAPSFARTGGDPASGERACLAREGEITEQLLLWQRETLGVARNVMFSLETSSIHPASVQQIFRTNWRRRPTFLITLR